MINEDKNFCLTLSLSLSLVMYNTFIIVYYFFLGTKSHGTSTSFVLKNEIVHGGFHPNTSAFSSFTLITSSSPFRLSNNAFVFSSTFSRRKYPPNVLTATIRSGTSITLTFSLDGFGASLAFLKIAGKKNRMLYFPSVVGPMDTGA